jgi:hypothetical protein
MWERETATELVTVALVSNVLGVYFLCIQKEQDDRLTDDRQTIFYTINHKR